MKHATKLDYHIDMGFLAEATITPFRDYAVLQRYSKGLPGDYDALADGVQKIKALAMRNALLSSFQVSC